MSPMGVSVDDAFKETKNFALVKLTYINNFPVKILKQNANIFTVNQCVKSVQNTDFLLVHIFLYSD